MNFNRNDWERKLSELAALRMVTMAINSDIGDLDKVVKVILEKACELIAANHGSLMLLNSETNTLHIGAVVGEDWTPSKRGCLLRLGEGITGRVAAHGQPYLCPDTKTDPHYFPLFENVLSELAVPVISQGKVLGVVNFDSDRQAAFSPTDIERVEMLADHAAIAIENSRQYALARAAKERWAHIFDSLPAAVAVCDEEFVVEHANQHFKELFGVNGNTPNGHSLNEVLRNFNMPKPDETWEDCLRGGQPIRHTYIHEKNQHHYAMQAIRAAHVDRPVFVVSFCDLTP